MWGFWGGTFGKWGIRGRGTGTRNQLGTPQKYLKSRGGEEESKRPLGNMPVMKIQIWGIFPHIHFPLPRPVRGTPKQTQYIKAPRGSTPKTKTPPPSPPLQPLPHLSKKKSPRAKEPHHISHLVEITTAAPVMRSDNCLTRAPLFVI